MNDTSHTAVGGFPGWTVRVGWMAACLCLLVAALRAQEIVDRWKFTLRPPGDGWQAAAFDDGDWQTGAGGFGSVETPGARIGTGWHSGDIWLRKSFELKSIPARPILLIHHDEDAEVFINGAVTRFTGFTTEYQRHALAADVVRKLEIGRNILAVHCRQTGGGQFIDVHVVDGERVPELPRPERSTKPFQSELITRWGSEVTPENAWTEYPRPHLVRDNWQPLNGHWDYAITPLEQADAPREWAGKILVPFCLESKLGGVQRLLDRTEALWYRRTFAAEKSAGRRTILNFEAVDYRCDVIVNGQKIGSHRGGHTPFSFDVSAALRSADNELVVRVEDATEGWQLRGKQVLDPRGIWYTQVSGIWQSVWLETVPMTSIADVKITTNAESKSIEVRPVLEGDRGDLRVQVQILDGDQVVAEQVGTDTIRFTLPQAKLWSPAAPHLYGLHVSLLDRQSRAIDKITSYAGIRSVGRVQDRDGRWRFTLNGQEIFHLGPLDQGWWPDGLLTPPADEAMQFEIEFLKSAGFNMLRKHIKVEPRRYYYHCDRLGMLVWQDQVSAGNNPPWTRLDPDPQDAEWPAADHQQFMAELGRMIDSLENHPSIVVWVPFNEAWGQHRTAEVGKWVVERDPTRLVNVASGGNFWPVGHVVDHHHYPHPDFPFDAQRFGPFIQVVGEFGGHGYPVPGHLWDANRRNWGYGGLPKNEAEYKERYVTSIKLLNDLRRRGIAAGVYTQTTDVEGEINGLLTYDRKVVKIPAAELAKLHRPLFEGPPPNKSSGVLAPPSPIPRAVAGRRPGPVIDAPAITAGRSRESGR